MVGKGGIEKTKRLMAVDSFLEITVEKCIFDD